jgi:predicted flap endonuclease-1-like 5' DNA nuclease
MSKNSLVRFVAIVLVILALVIMVGGIISALLLGQRGFGEGWSEGWTGWFTLPVIGLSCGAGFGLLMLGAILLLLVDISGNLASTQVVVQKPAIVETPPPAVVVETPAAVPVVAPVVAAVVAAEPVADAETRTAQVVIAEEETPPDLEAKPPAPKKPRKRAAAVVAAEAGVDAAALAAAGVVAAAAADEKRLPGAEEAALVSAELAAQKAEETQAPTRQRKPAKLNLRVAYVGAISEEDAARLNAIGVSTTGDLLARGATRKGRQEMADRTGIDLKLILTWVNHVDLFRLRGVGEEFAQLLEASGVDTVVELAQRNPANLQVRMAEVNEAQQLVRQVPVQSQVERWVEEAKTLPRVVTY